MTTRAGTGTGVWVGELSGHRVAEAAGVLARGLRDNPNFVDLFPDEEARARALPRLQEACLRDALGFGHVHAASRGDELVGISAWLPPGRSRSRRGGSSWLRRRWSACWPRPRGRYPASYGSWPALAAFTPRSRTGYLVVVGVEPDERGSGIGARLLRPVLDRARRGGGALLPGDHDGA